MFPLFIPSYNRPKPDILRWVRFLPKDAPYWFVVREEQRQDYAQSISKDHLLSIPDGAVTGIGSTRNFLVQYALDHGMPYIFDFDDDITYIHYCYLKQGGKQSHSTLGDYRRIPSLPYRILKEVSTTSEYLFGKYPKLVMGNMRRQRFSQWDYPIVAKVNGGSTPRQTKIIAVDRIAKHGLWVPPEFDKHGDDVGQAAHILAKGFKTFQLLPYIYDFVSEQVDSTLRDAKDLEANRPIHRKEYVDLCGYPMGKQYLRITKSYPDGEYMFGDVDWRAYHKQTGTKMVKESILDVEYGHIPMPVLRSQKEGGL